MSKVILQKSPDNTIITTIILNPAYSGCDNRLHNIIIKTTKLK